MRVQDLLNEFKLPELPPQPTFDDKDGDGVDDKEQAETPAPAEPVPAEPEAEPAQTAEPEPAPAEPVEPAPVAAAPVAEPTAQITEPVNAPVETDAGTEQVEATVERFNLLWDNYLDLDDKNPAKEVIFKVFQTVAELGGTLKETQDSLSSQEQVAHSCIRAFLNICEMNGNTVPPGILAMLDKAETVVEVTQDKEVKKALLRHDTSTRLTVEEKFLKKDKELEQLAQEKAMALNMPLRWARNLIGMFGMELDKDQRNAFMAACHNNTALRLNDMMAAKQGNLDEFVEGSVKPVFDSIKSTLLDISLSTGQGAATGPFEALLAIMGGAQKAPTGDLLINGKKYEVKSCSISLKTTKSKKGEDISGGNSNAWLDATAELAPAKARAVFTGVIKSLGIRTALPEKADFRPGLKLEDGPLSVLSGYLQHKSVASNAQAIMEQFHATMYPTVANPRASGVPLGVYNFKAACKRILNYIYALDAEGIAKEQGIMAMLEYRVGKYESGFILYNSSVQTFKVIDEPADIAGLLKGQDADESFNVNFQKSTITIASGTKGRKSAPGIYFGPSASSPRGQQYVDNKRGERGIEQRIQQGAKYQEAWEDGVDTPEYLPDAKTKAAKKKALKEVDDFISFTMPTLKQLQRV